MKSTFVFLVYYFLCLLTTFSQETPQPLAVKDYSPYPNPHAGYVSDLAGILSEKQKGYIEQLLLTIEVEYKLEVIVMTIPSLASYPDTDNKTIESFATSLFNAYGIGNMPENNGVLFLVSMGDRKARIELGSGYGSMADQRAADIMNTVIIPRFKASDYSGGIKYGTIAIVEKIGGIKIENRTISFLNVILTGASIIFLISVAVSLFRHGKSGWGWIFVGFIIALIMALLRILETFEGSSNRSGRSDQWKPGGHGGFGGGSSSGGGASGSW